MRGCRTRRCGVGGQPRGALRSKNSFSALSPAPPLGRFPASHRSCQPEQSLAPPRSRWRHAAGRHAARLGSVWLNMATVLTLTRLGRVGSLRGDDLVSPARMRTEHSVIEEQVDARPRRESGEALEEFQGVEQQVRRPVGPPVAQPQQDLGPPSVGQPDQTVGTPDAAEHGRVQGDPLNRSPISAAVCNASSSRPHSARRIAAGSIRRAHRAGTIAARTMAARNVTKPIA